MIPRILDTITRHKLENLTQEIPEKKISVVAAGAGYGKTTFIAQVVQEYDTVWYRLDSLDRDFATFMSHLVAGVRRIHQEFGKGTARRLEDGKTLGMEYKGITALFIHELGSVLRKDVMIVLDDFHNVQDSLVIRDTVQILAENLCPSAHLIIISRTDVPLQLSRLRAMREVLDISQEDLIFTSDEIRRFFQELFRISISEDILMELHDKTDGWVSALILLIHSIRQSNALNIENEVRKLKGSQQFISDYLAENVYATLKTETKSFLLKTSILSRLNAIFCNRLLGISNATEILGELRKRHLFTFALDDEGLEYCYHQLFQEYLRSALTREMNSAEKEQLHLEAASILEDSGEDEEAVKHYLMAGAYEQACIVLEKITIVLIGSGRSELMNSFLEKIPEPFYRSHPWLEYQRGFTYIFSGRFAEAGSCFLNAFEHFNEKKDQSGIDRCLNIMAMGLYLEGDFPSAMKIFEELLKSPLHDPLLRVEALTQLVFITSQLGKMEESDFYYEEALKSLPDIKETVLRDISHSCLMLYHCFRHAFCGDYLKAVSLSEATKEKIMNSQNDRLLPLGYQLSSMSYAYLGYYNQGLEEALKGLALIKEKGYSDISYGWILCNAGMNACGLGKMEDAVQYAQDALRHFQDLKTRFGVGSAYLALGTIYMYAGKFSLAEEMVHACMDSVKGLNLPHITAPAKGTLAYVLMQEDNLDEAERLIKEAHAEFSCSTLFDCIIYRLYAHLFWKRGLLDDALESLHKCLRIAEAKKYDRGLVRNLSVLMPLLVMLYTKGIMQHYIRNLLSIAGDDARLGLMSFQKNADQVSAQAVSDILKAMPEPSRPGLRVYCLGRFHVFRGQEEITQERWKSSKSKMLFKLLVLYRKKGFVSKEVFMEHLWPEDDPDKTSTRFHVALTTLRRILEPGLKRGLTSAYLKSSGDTYLLDIGEKGMVDLEVFEEAYRRAKTVHDPARAIDHLLEAERIYKGDFLAEDLYEPWCMEERDRAKSLYLSVLEGIIDFFISRKEYAKAIEYCNRHLAIDAYAENIYQLLMRLFNLTGNNSMVLKVYGRCKDMIVAELGCPLSRKTELLAKELLQ